MIEVIKDLPGGLVNRSVNDLLPKIFTGYFLYQLYAEGRMRPNPLYLLKLNG